MWLAVLAIVALAACGEDAESPASPQGQVQELKAEGPPCDFVDSVPFHDVNTTCIEVVYDHVTPPEAAPALAGLAFAPDGTLYMARTAFGEIWAMRDEDGDQFMDEPHLFADGLRLPTGIAAHDGALYVVSVGGVLRLEDTDGDDRVDVRTVLVDDLAVETGFWPGSVGIGPDGRLYVSLGAGCNACAEDDPRRGALLSYALDGGDERVEASGLRNPADFAWHPETGELWIVDSGRVMPGTDPDGPPDELNRVVAGAHYGFPYCYGDRVPDRDLSPPDTGFCTDTERPTVTFQHQSSPFGIAFYTSEAFPSWEGDLVVAFRGSWNLPEPAGYALDVIGFEGAVPDGIRNRIAPISPEYYPDFSLAEFSLSGRGFFPYRPVDVVVSPEGWLYVSIEEGRIFRFRPRPAARAPQSGASD